MATLRSSVTAIMCYGMDMITETSFETVSWFLSVSIVEKINSATTPLADTLH